LGEKVSATPAALELIAQIVAAMFSLDNGREVRFLTRSRICSSDQGAQQSSA